MLNRERIYTASASLVFIVLFVYVIIILRNFLYPLFIAVFLSYMLYRPANYLEKLKVPRIIANLFTIFICLLAVYMLGRLLYVQLQSFLQDFPAMNDQMLQNVIQIESKLERIFRMDESRKQGWLAESVIGLIDLSGTFIRNILSSTTDTVVKLLLIPVYIFFILYYRNKFEIFLFRITSGEKHKMTQSVVLGITGMMKNYVTGVVIVILILCVINSLGLMIVGIKYPVLLGIISALFNFIPYFGTLIGGAVPFIFSLLTEDFATAGSIVVLFLIVQFLENNILTPNITGGQVRINPFFTILSIIAGGMLWGLPGMILAVPVVGILKIIFDHVPSLEPYSFLLGKGGTEEHALTFDKIKIKIKKVFRKK
ncbi:MAG: AI-2E family transporter [Cytophagaceae bacterium]